MINKVILLGRLGDAPEVRHFDSGGMIATVGLATTEKWRDRQSGELREATEWHRLVFNDRRAEIARDYLAKGSLIYIEGGLRTRKYTDRDGATRYTTEVRVRELRMLDSRGRGQTESAPAWAQGQNGAPQQNHPATGQNNTPNAYRAAKNGAVQHIAENAKPADGGRFDPPAGDALDFDDIPF